MKRGMVLALAALAGLAACSPAEDKPVAPAPAPVQQVEVAPAAYRGAAVAGQVCAQCHDVGQGAAAQQAVGAPDFRDIAGRESSTAEGLAGWMAANHPKMPNYLFSGGEVSDLAAYIMSLRGKGD